MFNKDNFAIEATTASSAIQLGPIAPPNGDIVFVTSQGDVQRPKPGNRALAKEPV
jgi:hypothetical protein